MCRSVWRNFLSNGIVMHGYGSTWWEVPYLVTLSLLKYFSISDNHLKGSMLLDLTQLQNCGLLEGLTITSSLIMNKNSVSFIGILFDIRYSINNWNGQILIFSSTNLHLQLVEMELVVKNLGGFRARRRGASG